jgi:hypothetical protein
MKRQLSLVAFFFLGVTAYAQDVDFGAFNDAGSLLGPAAPAARGAAPARGTATPAPPPDRLVRLREALVKADAPLTREQETELNKIIDTEIPKMRKTIQTHGQQMMAERGVSTAPPAPASAPAPGAAPAPPAPAAAAPPAAQPPASPLAPAAAPAPARGAAPAAGAPPNAALLAALAARTAPPPSSRVPAEVLDALEVEMRQLNDALFMQIATAPALKPAQQTVLTKMSRDQIRSRGGFDALRIAMEDAGAPFTAEQTPKVQALFDEQKVARANLARESQGTPDAAKLKQLERDTLTKVVGLLVPAQRTALLAMLRAQQ